MTDQYQSDPTQHQPDQTQQVPPQQPPTHRPERSRFVTALVSKPAIGIYGGIIGVIIGAAAGGADTDDTASSSPTATVTADPTATPTVTATATATVEATVTAPPPPPEAAITGDGIFIVGEDIEPGTYEANADDFCYWARLSGTSGELDDIIANGNGPGHIVVTIKESDKAFETTGCGDWAKS